MLKDKTVIRAFSEEHAAALTGLSRGQLRAWDRAGFFQPNYAFEDRRSAYSRVYSFRDIVGLRTIAVLMKEHRVSLRELRRVADELISRGYDHWADLKLYVLKRKVYFREPGTEKVEGVWDGQYAMLQVVDVVNDVTDRVKALQKRAPELVGTVEQHKYVVRNTSVIAGTRIPTAAIKRYRDAGYTISQIMKEYPSLKRKDIQAALKHEERLAQSA